MESKRDCGNFSCEVCKKEFSSISSKNRHLRNFHDKTVEGKKTQRIMCPQCPQEEKFTCYDNLMKHLQQIHNVNISESVLSFRNFQDFEAWRELESREVDYACYSRRKLLNGEENIYYNCNRSDSKGFSSTSEKRNMKSGGSIRIRGVCPSRIVAKLSRDGSVLVKFIETHVGHADELRTKRLSKSEQKVIVGQLTAGVTNERIIQDARIIENDTLKRMNVITRGDLAYLIRKFNVNKMRDSDDMIATTLKIEEGNRQGKNHAFLFKKIVSSMQPCDVQDMFKRHFDDPCFFVDGYNLGRGLLKNTTTDANTPFIKSTKSIKCWRIIEEQLENKKDIGIFFDEECYLIQWRFEFIVNTSNTPIETTLFYYWKGCKATKGFSPLPPEIENLNPIVERICQWSEPALFFHMFAKNFIVLSGKEQDFKLDVKRMFMVLGELESEIHLYERPCLKRNLRSKAVFIIIEPSTNKIFYWYGSAVSREFQQLVQNTVVLNGFEDTYKNFDMLEIRESEYETFLSLVDPEKPHPVNRNFTPKLFYLNSITGQFLATEVEYPLRSKDHVAAFPFVQSHLYTAPQPALFILDSGDDVWVWEGERDLECDVDICEKELILAKQTATKYAQEKAVIIGVAPKMVKHCVARKEAEGFVNLFPYWNQPFTY